MLSTSGLMSNQNQIIFLYFTKHIFECYKLITHQQLQHLLQTKHLISSLLAQKISTTFSQL